MATSGAAEPQTKRGFWELVLSRSSSHGKMRGLLNNWLPNPDQVRVSSGSTTELSACSKQSKLDEADEWRRVKEVYGRGEHGEEHTQSTRSDHTHSHDSSVRGVSGADTAPTGRHGLSASPRDEMDVPPTPSTEAVLHISERSVLSAEAAVLDEDSGCRLNTCAECNETIGGAIFMLNDQPYCCQRHRLAAYHKAEKQRLSSKGAPPLSLGSGLAAQFGTW